MRTITRLRAGFCFLFAFFVLSLNAQETGSQAYWIHEDVVKPSMSSEYEAVCKELTAALNTHGIAFPTIVTQTMDNRYLWVTPISSMADIENNTTWSDLSEKMGRDAVAAIFNRMDKCYEIEQNYVLHLDKDLSYMPDGITQTPEGKNYRSYFYLHYNPENRGAIMEQMKAVKTLFSSKGSPSHYRVYRSGFGARGEFLMVAVASANPQEDATMGAENQQMLGEEGRATMDALFKMLRKYEEYNGWMRPDLIAGK